MPMRKVELLRAACCVAGLDQTVTAEEMAWLTKLADLAGVGRTSLNAMIDRAKRDKEFFEEQFELVRGDPDYSLKVLFGVACADKNLTIDERLVLHHFATRLGISDERFNQLLDAAKKHVKQKPR